MTAELLSNSGNGYAYEQWRKPRTRGKPEEIVYVRGCWVVARSGILHHTVTDARLARKGIL